MNLISYIRKVYRVIKNEINSYLKALSNENGFIRHSFTLSVGTTIAQAIPIVFSPVLTRIFSPEEFGLLAVVSSISAIISVISTGKFETVIVVADDKKDAANLVAVSLILSLLISLLVSIILIFFSDVIIYMLKQPRLKYWIFICPLSALFISVYQVYNEWCIRGSQYVRLSLNKIINSSSITGSNLFFGFTKIADGGLIIGELTGRFISAASCIISALRKDYSTFTMISWKRSKELIIKFRECPTFILPGQLINMLGGQIPILIISYFFSEKEVGFFSVARMALTVPVSMITLAVRDVFKQRANDEYRLKKNCLNIYKRMAKSLLILSILIFGVLFFILPTVFTFVFGQKWKEAGEFAQIFCPMVMINFISESFTGLFYITKKLRKVLFWQILYFSFTVIFLFAGYYIFKDIKMVLISFVTGRIMVDLISLSMTYKLSKGESQIID
jgi:O-antigen/teichoic acid export membrane protein